MLVAALTQLRKQSIGDSPIFNLWNAGVRAWGGGDLGPLRITPAQAAFMPTSTRSRYNRGAAQANAVADTHVSEPDSESVESLPRTQQQTASKHSVGVAEGGVANTTTGEVTSTVRLPNTPYLHSVRS